MTRIAAAERERLSAAENGMSWRDRGSYVAERARGTVRADYSAVGSARTYFPHDRAFSENFHGDTGRGPGASHRPGRSALVAELILQRSES